MDQIRPKTSEKFSLYDRTSIFKFDGHLHHYASTLKSSQDDKAFDVLSGGYPDPVGFETLSLANNKLTHRAYCIELSSSSLSTTAFTSALNFPVHQATQVIPDGARSNALPIYPHAVSEAVREHVSQSAPLISALTSVPSHQTGEKPAASSAAAGDSSGSYTGSRNYSELGELNNAQGALTYSAESDQAARLPRIHAGRGTCQLFGQFIHVEFIWLALVECLVSLCVWDVALGSNLLLDIFRFGLLPGQPLAELTFCVLLGFSVLLSLGLYDSCQRSGVLGIAKHLLVGAGAIFILLLGISLLAEQAMLTGLLGRELVLLSNDALLPLLMGMGLLLLALACVRGLFYRFVDGCLFVRRILVVGSGQRAEAIANLRRKSDQRGFKLLGFIEFNPLLRCSAGETLQQKIIVSTRDLYDYCTRHQVDEIVLAIDDRRGGLPTSELLDCRMNGIEIIDDLDFIEREAGLLQLDVIQPSWLIHASGFHRHAFKKWLKRAFDVLFTSLLSLVLLPLALLTVLAIILEDGLRAPIFYNQTRVGERGRLFKVFKFRSMSCDAEADGTARWAAKNDARVTRVGAVIRKYRLDEIPQLWNILCGEMSLVGPRPERPDFVRQLAKVNPFYLERHRLAPGLTGWAQLYYPYGASTHDAIEKLKFDLYYLKHQSLLLDLYILMKTVDVVLFKQGAR